MYILVGFKSGWVSQRKGITACTGRAAGGSWALPERNREESVHMQNTVPQMK